MHEDSLVLADDVARGGRQRRTRGKRTRGENSVAFHVQVARPVGAILKGDHLEGVDREQLPQRAIEAGENAGLVQGGGHRAGNAVQRLQAPGLVACELVERCVGQQHPEPAVHVFEELQLHRRHPALAIGVIRDAADDLALVHDRDPDHELAADAGAGALADLLPRRLDWQDGGLRVRVLAREGRLAHRPATHVLQHAGVHGQRVVPALSFQDLQVDGVVTEPRPQPPIKDLDQVRFGDAAAQLVDQRGGRRA